MDIYFIFSVASDIFCLLLCMIGVVIVCMCRQTLKRWHRLIIAVFLAHAAQVLFNLLGLLFKGGTAPCVHAVLFATNFMEFASGYVLSFLMTLYMINCVAHGAGTLSRWKKAAVFLCSVSLIMLVVSQFTGLYYTIDAENYYHRMDFFPLSLMFAVAALVMQGVLVCRYRARLTTEEKIAFSIYIILPVLGLSVQTFIYGIYFLILADTMAMVLMFLILLFVQTKQYYGNELELERTRYNLMLSQIKPHFLYNALAAIEDLCATDPEKAERTIASFSRYLRGNLRTLNDAELIPFSEELKHLKSYLDIEQVRFESRLRIVMDIGPRDFFLPALTVQPIVENAIKHGVTRRAAGGTVTIRTEDRTEAWQIMISDDGVGFKPGDLPDDGQNHIGIQSVRERLCCLCDGELTIQSAPGQGTVAVMHIPKNGG